MPCLCRAAVPVSRRGRLRAVGVAGPRAERRRRGGVSAGGRAPPLLLRGVCVVGVPLPPVVRSRGAAACRKPCAERHVRPVCTGRRGGGGGGGGRGSVQRRGSALRSRWGAHRCRGALTPAREWDKAAGILEDALQLRPDSAEGLYLLAFALSNASPRPEPCRRAPRSRDRPGPLQPLTRPGPADRGVGAPPGPAGAPPRGRARAPGAR